MMLRSSAIAGVSVGAAIGSCVQARHTVHAGVEVISAVTARTVSQSRHTGVTRVGIAIVGCVAEGRLAHLCPEILRQASLQRIV